MRLRQRKRPFANRRNMIHKGNSNEKYYCPSSRLLIAGLFTALVTPPAQGGESHVFAADHGLGARFYLIGGQYSIYVNAKRPIHGAHAPESSSCLFGGNLQRVWPTQNSFSLGAGIIVPTLVPHRIGPKPITLPGGLYAILCGCIRPA